MDKRKKKNNRNSRNYVICTIIGVSLGFVCASMILNRTSVSGQDLPDEARRERIENCIDTAYSSLENTECEYYIMDGENGLEYRSNKTDNKQEEKSLSKSNNASCKDDWEKILVNRNHPVPNDWEPQLVYLNNGEQIDERILPYLQEMFDDMREEGLSPVVSSGYRSSETQAQLMQNRIDELMNQGMTKEEAEEEARNWIAIPGTSEHQLGLAVDIIADDSNDSYDDNELDFQVYYWLAENAHKYGFILRYPEGKTDITGVSYEPWHYRYVGKEPAEEIYKSGKTMEEYLGIY